MAIKTKKSAAVTTVIPPLYGRVREILEVARSNIARTVNSTQVVANWLIGREIIEEEQAGKRLAGYGTELLRELAARLKADFGTGYGVDNLELFRRFYLEYTQLLPGVNSETVSRKSGGTDAERTIREFRMVASEAALGLRDYSSCWIQP